ncbi:MFS transporter [Halobacteriales archaeon QS_1_68_20]|nr:MAG: MFS transporter [Halobacteriales archaeon QS_1_68_20]
MTSPDTSTVVRRFYLYRATTSVGFVTPVYTLFLLFKDLTYTQIGVLGALSAVLVLVGEVPTGYVGDRVGRRDSMLLASLLSSTSLAGFVFVETFAGFVVVYVPWALGLAFASGSNDAWLYDALSERLAEEKFTRIRGRAGAVQRWTSVVTMIAGSVLFVFDPVVPFVAAAVLNATGAVVLLSLPRNRQSLEGDTLAVREAMGVLRADLTAPPLRAFVAYVALSFGLISVANVYVQPITVGVLDGRLSTLPVVGEVPVAATLGLMYAGFTAVAAVASYYAGAVEDLLGLRGAALALPFGTAAALVVPLVVPAFAIPAFFVMRASGTVFRPIANRYVNDHTGSAGRATVLSAASMVYALVRTPLKVGAGLLADATGEIPAVATLALGFLAVAGLLVVFGRPVGRGEDAGTTPAD